MVLVGLILIALGALAIVAALFSLSGDATLLGADTTAVVVFFVGLAAGIAILWGFGILKFGTKRSIAQRRENKRLEELSGKLDRVEYERRKDDDEHEDRPTL